jgi:hypothetical protein
MIPVLTHHAQQSLNTVRGVYLLLDIFRKASYLDYCEGVIVCPAPYRSLVELSGYGYKFSYQKEFSFVGSVDFILSIHVDTIVERILKTVPKPDCHVTFQKKKRKK